MTSDDFRHLALAHRGVVEGSHMGHPDFRINGKIVTSLRSAKNLGDVGMVKVTPEEQATLIRDHPGVFQPESGAWGRQGCTRVLLASTDAELVGPAMTMAVRGRRT